MNLDKLSEIQLDALRETGSIGAGHAATALSQLVGHGIQIDRPIGRAGGNGRAISGFPRFS